MPLLAVRLVDPFIGSDLVQQPDRGAIRLIILVGYVGGIGLMKDIQRVFAYHGAEHMAVHTHEAGLSLTVENVRKFDTPIPGAARPSSLPLFLFPWWYLPSWAGRTWSGGSFPGCCSSRWWHPSATSSFASTGCTPTWPIARLMSLPGLWMQRLTTRQPEDDQIEVAITAMGAALAADAGQSYIGPFAAFADTVEEAEPQAAEGEDSGIVEG